MPKRRRKLPKNLYWNGKVIWARIKVKGQEHRWSLRTDDQQLAQTRFNADRKRLIAAAHYGDARTSYEDAVISWAENFIPERGIGPATAKRYASSLRQLESRLRGRFVDEIDDDLISIITRERRMAGATPATIRRDLTALSSVLIHAGAEGWMRGNPALDRLRSIRERRDPIVLPEPADIEKVIRRAPGLFSAMIRAAWATGCRQNELATALRRNLDHDRRELTVIGKGNKLRVINLNYGGAYDLLRHLPAHVGSHFLFWHGKNGERYRNVSSRFAAIVREVSMDNLEFRPFRFHDLRHLHAVEWLRAGRSIYLLSKHLGHSSIKTTEIYLNYLAPNEAVNAKRLSEHSDAQPGGNPEILVKGRKD
jgi:integrase/recombinase XerD